jgi:hypothetical protein
MTKEKYEEIKKGYLENIKRYMLSVGGLFPHVTVFGAHKDDENKDAIIHIPIPDEFLKSEDTKDEFVNTVLPEVAKTVKTKFIPYGVGWASEAWVRTSSKDDKIPDNWKDLPIKKEVLFINLEFEDKTEAIMYEIKRLGKQVNEDGDLVDHVDLIEDKLMAGPENMSGRFTGLLDKFVKAHS